MDDRSRESLLRELISGASSAEEVLSQLAVFGWDSEHELVVMTRKDAESILGRYIDDELTQVDVAKWADAIEAREDIAFEASAKSLLGALVFELANPEISPRLTIERAEDWVRRLRSSRIEEADH